jgi:outer membrane receptor for ferrienterochelin and colicin
MRRTNPGRPSRAWRQCGSPLRIPILKVAWLLLLPALVGGQATDPLPVRHDSVEVHDTAPEVPASSSPATSVKPADVKDLPSRPATVNDALPLLPGIVRSPTGGLRINGLGEQRGAMLVNQADVTDPATGSFGASVPVDSVEVVNVLRTPFLAQYGRFSSGVVAVETKRGSDKWHFELNDPFPDFRVRSWHLRGLQDASPRLVIGGPLIENRLYFAQTVLYDVQKVPNRTLPFPDNTSKQELVNSFTQFDYILSAKQCLTATLHLTPQHINFVNPDFFNPEPVTPIVTGNRTTWGPSRII